MQSQDCMEQIQGQLLSAHHSLAADSSIPTGCEGETGLLTQCTGGVPDTVGVPGTYTRPAQGNQVTCAVIHATEY